MAIILLREREREKNNQLVYTKTKYVHLKNILKTSYCKRKKKSNYILCYDHADSCLFS